MASQISHIIYAQKYFDRLEEGILKSEIKINKDDFFLGCVFPDIRRIDSKITRAATHLFFPTLNLDFKGLSSFEAGWKFHLYCDMRREDILNKNNFYSQKFTTDFFNSPAKLLEDQLVYAEYNNWEKLEHFFSRAPVSNLQKINITSETFHLWYAILASYVKNKPDDKTTRIFLSKMPSLAPKANAIMQSIEGLRKNKKILGDLEKIKDEII